MVGISIDDSAQSRRFEVFFLVVAQVYYDRGSTCGLGLRLDSKLPLAIGGPAPTFALTGFPALDLDFFCDHKRRIEADSKLPNETHILACVARQLADK